MPDSDPSFPTAGDPRARSIAAWLAGVRRTAKGLLLVQRLGWIIAGVIAALVIGGVLDYFLRAPSWLRGIGLLGALATLAVVLWRRVLPAVRFAPSLTEIALRVESSQPGAGAPGVLASGLELGEVGSTRPESVLAEPVVARAAELTTRLRPTDVFRPAGAIKAGGVALVGVLAVLALFAAQPRLSAIGFSRMALPWAGAEWPKRTQIADATGLSHHPLGSALPLRAALLRSDRGPENTGVYAVYRLVGPAGGGPERRVILKDQPTQATISTPDGEARGTLFERLIEPTGLTPDLSAARANAPAATMLEYWLETADDRTPSVQIALVDPPSVVKSTLRVELPGYAATLLGSTPGVQAPLDLGPGGDERAAPAPILTGSRVAMTIELNKPVPPPPASTSAAARESWLASTLGPDMAALFTTEPPALLDAPAGGKSWTLSWTHTRAVRLAVKPVDEYGIGPGEESVYRFDLLTDNPPTAAVTTPTEDRSVLPTAVVALAGEGRDDVGLSHVSLERQIARRAKASESPAAEPADERVEIIRETVAAAGPEAGGVKRLTASTQLDLSTLELKPGDEVWITALAADAFELAGQRHPPARSSVRKLRIMSRDQLVEQIWGELSGVRRNAIRIDQDQAEAQNSAAQPGEESGKRSERAQAQLTERLARQGEAVKRLRQRVDENGLPDASVNQVLRDAEAALQRAGQQSAKASEKLGESARAQAQEAAPKDAGAAERQEGQQGQQGVRDELTNLIDLLDQGQDTFASKRSLERLLEQQKSLRDRTEQTGKTTTGKPAESLSEGEKAALEKIAEDQRALAEQLRDTLSKVQEREEKLRKNDPAAAQALAQAAQQTKRDQTPEKMDQAASQAQQNQPSNARQQQTAAIESLEQALKKLDQAQNNKDEVLSRFLASLIESIQGLVAQQKAELAELKAREATADFKGLDAGMATLHRNTLGVLDEANDAPREVAPVAKLIARAADAQAQAVTLLRAAPVVEDEVAKQENESLDRLNEALTRAQDQQRQARNRQAQQKRTELRAKYEEALKQQLALKDNVDGLAQQEPSRRTRAAARIAGEEQQALLKTLEDLRESTKEIAEAKVFDYAHTRLKDLMTAASTGLVAGEASPAVLRQQTSAARVLRSLVEALDDRKKPDDPFRKGEQQGQGGGSGQQPQPLVPPAAEIVLLKAMQQEAAELTRAAAEGKSADPAALKDAAKLQTDLSTQGQGLLERLSKEAEEGGPMPTPEIKPGEVKPEPAKPGAPEEGAAE